MKSLEGINYWKGIIITIAAIIPLFVASFLGNLPVGMVMTMGVLLASPSDVPGNFRRRLIGIVISIGIAVSSTFIMAYASKNILTLVPALVIFVFGFSFISVYGFRASLVSFSGLLAVILSMARIPSEDSILVHSLLIGCGGVWYLSLMVFLHFFNLRQEVEKTLSEGFDLTADYLRIRAELINAPHKDQEELKKELALLQTQLNEKHETIRELVISKRRNSGRSSGSRKKLLIFMEMVDILELAMANPVNYERMDKLFENQRDKLEVLKEWSLLMAKQLNVIADSLNNNKKYKKNPVLETYTAKMEDSILALKEEKGLPQSREALLVLRGLFHFKEKQFEKILSIERLLQNLESKDQFSVKRKEAIKFIPNQDFSFKTLQDNLDFESPIFRHSLRLVLIVLIGYAIGIFLEIQNAYWILLTSLVIMRPGYGLTKERSKQRLYGTLIGAVIATAIIIFTQNPVVHAILATISLMLAFAMFQKNYKTAAIFITLNIVFVYSLIVPDAFKVVQFRVIDTLIGAGLAFAGNSFLWPTWEYKEIKKFIAGSIKANQDYLTEIDCLYQQKNHLSSSYKLARKQAFLAMGNLSAAFQRMTQEPRSKQKNFENTYKIVGLNQELLSSMASLGSFIRTHRTTAASQHFNILVSAIQANLSYAVAKLEKKPVIEDVNADEVWEAQLYFKDNFDELIKLRNKEIEEGRTVISPGMRSKFQEAQLVMDQLKWLIEISENLKTRVLMNTWN